MNQKATNRVKPYEELEFRDNFMFSRVMLDKQLCRDVLECLLQHPVGELDDPIPEREFQHTSDGKSIRLDIYTRYESTVYDAEMQNLNHKSIDSLQLPRRTRFYQASIDMDHLDKGESYRTLPDSTILFICTFDPFGKGLSKYTLRGICEEDRDIIIDDGAERIFYNCSYRGGDIPADLRQFYDYVETGRSSNDLTKRIDRAVENARLKEEWRSIYMYYDINIMDAREEGREEGRAEGREEGRAEGREEGRVEGREEGRAEGRAEERKNTEAAIRRAEIAEERVKELEAKLSSVQ
ncbi:MAG: Rpn family recombination-promoting nuclease/putative transposase [Lachnospiraceae bacterium]|nr:Rpn family recombination-promoting nuclease/putative transposase [Lachnospiraceae bacterium]